MQNLMSTFIYSPILVVFRSQRYFSNMRWIILFTLFFNYTTARKIQPLRIRIRNEAADLDNGFGHVRVEFEANSNVDVTWCEEFPSNGGTPGDCVSLAGNPNYKIRKDVSLFYFSYVGSASIASLLSPFKRPPVIRFISKQGNLHLDHKVIANDLDLAGKVKISRSKVEVPEIINVLPPVVKQAQMPVLTCTVQSDKLMEVTWLMTSTQGTLPLFQFGNMADQQTNTVNGEIFEGRRLDKTVADGVLTQSTLKMTSPNKQADVITCVFSPTDKEKVNTVHISTIVE